MHPTIEAVTSRIRDRSRETRQRYLARIAEARSQKPKRGTLSCGNLAHGFAACSAEEKEQLAAGTLPNLGIVSAYNDMLSAHRPLEAIIRP